MAAYTIGVDLGTLSARAVVAEIGTGRELGDAVKAYPHAVLDRSLPTGEILPPDWALQHPADWEECLFDVIPRAVRNAGVDPDRVIGIGIDCTCSTMLPVDAAGMPLCLKPEWAHEKHAWPKLWKHHGTQRDAEEMTELAGRICPDLLSRYGGRINPEWAFPKIRETLRGCPAVYHAAARFAEAADWLTFLLTGEWNCSAAIAGFKYQWDRDAGFPPMELLTAMDPELRDVYDKLPTSLIRMGERAGSLTPDAAARLGLKAGIAVSASMIDGHAPVPAVGDTREGTMLLTIGTSTVNTLISGTCRPVEGICGVVRDGFVAGLWGYEAGQSGVGDIFNWFTDRCAPAYCKRMAEEQGKDLHVFLTEQAARLKPGESGLLALDWWNGNRSVLADASLSGLLIGMTLETRPEEIYRALIEATAFGARRILDAFEEQGVPISRVVACGGVAKKNALLMQIYADVFGRPIGVVRSAQAPALGSAMFAAVAAGAYPDIASAAAEMGGLDPVTYQPDEEHHRIYEELYGIYLELHDRFGRGGSDAMRRLKKLR